MTPRDPEVLASRWRLDDLLAGSRDVEVHAATDTDLDSDVVAVLWADDPGAERLEVDDGEIALVDSGVADGIWFATYARLDGAPMSPAAQAALARSFVPDDGVGPPTMEVPSARRRRGVLASATAGLLGLLALGAIVVGQSGDEGGGPAALKSPTSVEDVADEPLREALRGLRAVAGPEAATEVAAVEQAVVRRDWPAAEQALDRLRRRDRPRPDGRPGPLAVAVERVRAALPSQRVEAADGAAAEVAVPCEPTTTTTSTTSSSTPTTTTTTAAPPPASSTTTTTAPCEPTTADAPTTSTTTVSPSSSTSTSSTTTTSSTSTTTTSTTVPTTTSSTSSTSTSSTTTVAPTRPRR